MSKVNSVEVKNQVTILRNYCRSPASYVADSALKSGTYLSWDQQMWRQVFRVFLSPFRQLSVLKKVSTAPSGPGPPQYRGFKTTHTPHSVGFHWTSDQPVNLWQYTTQQTDIHAPAGFESAIPAGQRPQTHALDCADTGIGQLSV